jgi:hypothetical protein
MQQCQLVSLLWDITCSATLCMMLLCMAWQPPGARPSGLRLISQRQSSRQRHLCLCVLTPPPRARRRCVEQALQFLAATSPQLAEAQLAALPPGWPRRAQLLALAEQLAAVEESLAAPYSQVVAARDRALAGGLRQVALRVLRVLEPLLVQLAPAGREQPLERLTDRTRSVLARAAR